MSGADLALFPCSQGVSSTDQPLWAPQAGLGQAFDFSHSGLDDLLVELCGVFTFPTMAQAEEEEKTWPFSRT